MPHEVLPGPVLRIDFLSSLSSSESYLVLCWGSSQILSDPVNAGFAWGTRSRCGSDRIYSENPTNTPRSQAPPFLQIKTVVHWQTAAINVRNSTDIGRFRDSLGQLCFIFVRLFGKKWPTNRAVTPGGGGGRSHTQWEILDFPLKDSGFLVWLGVTGICFFCITWYSQGLAGIYSLWPRCSFHFAAHHCTNCCLRRNLTYLLYYKIGEVFISVLL